MLNAQIESFIVLFNTNQKRDCSLEFASLNKLANFCCNCSFVATTNKLLLIL